MEPSNRPERSLRHFFPSAKGFGLGRQKKPCPALWFSSATRWPLFRASVPQEAVFPVVKGGHPAGQLQRDFQRPFALTHSPAVQVARYDRRTGEEMALESC